MEKFSLKYKIIALLLVLIFTFQTMESINEHSYSIVINSYHLDYSYISPTPAHLAFHCSLYNCNF